jgi:hypothetical protein
MIDIAVNNRDLENAEEFLKGFGKTAKRAVARVVNRTAAGVRTDAVKEVRKEYTVKATTVRKSFKIKKAGNSVLEAAAVSSGPRLGLIHFGARPGKPNGKRTPVSVQVRKKRKIVKNAFVAKMPSGHVGVFERSGEFGRNRKKYLERIRNLYTLAVPSMASKEDVEEEIRLKAYKRFSKDLYHEIDYAMDNMHKRRGF